MCELKGKTFFVSDVHLGAPGDPTGEREKNFVSFLESLPAETERLYLLGDIFDFWVEYRDVAPRGFVRTLAALARLADRGVKIWFFTGNHDYWFSDYLENEIGMTIVKDPYRIEELDGKTVCMGHGDGVGKHSLTTMFIFRMIRSPFCITLLKALHPRLIFRIARLWSKSSRRKQGRHHYFFRGEDDPLYIFADELSRKRKIDLFVFGHLHSHAEMVLPSGARLVILDDWGRGANYLSFSGM